MDIDTDEFLLNAIKWAKEAGAVQLSFFRGNNLEIVSKINDSDIVTAADKASERIILDGINSVYPNHAILSEESGANDIVSDFTWVVDPLDGTTNFSVGLPQFSVSIGLQYKGETIIGVVYAPYLDELFTAVKNGGAYFNGNKIITGTTQSIHQAVLSTGFPIDKDTSADNNMDNLERILPLVRGMRRMGSAAIDISYVAAGFLDGYWELNLHEWDVCAGLLIAQEAGATAFHFREDRNVSVLVASPQIAEVVKPLLSTLPRV